MDAVVIGGGPAGLVAATYLARFKRRFLLVDNDSSRARYIPVSRNIPGFSNGIGGVAFLERLRKQARRFGASIVSDEIHEIAAERGTFKLRAVQALMEARTVLLATGVRDVKPLMTGHDEAVARGLLRYCPICDGYEAKGRKVAVLSAGAKGTEEADFLKTFSDQIVLVPAKENAAFPLADVERLRSANVRVMDCPPISITPEVASINMQFPQEELRFDCLYAALGSEPNSILAKQLGANLTENGCIVTDRHQQTSLPGLYAAGDVVEGLDQVSVAAGQAAIAATAIHNRLRQLE